MWQALGALRLDRGGSSIQQRLPPSRLARQPDFHTEAVDLSRQQVVSDIDSKAIRVDPSPSNDGTELKPAIMPDGVPIEIAPERREEFSPGLDAELLQMIQATAEQELRKADKPGNG
jgi:hypothetical protein